jgi:charged multivesicular body protein 3
MKLVNGIMKASEMALTMQEFSCKMLKLAGVIDDMMWNELESALDDDEIEEEEEDCKVLSELAGETAAQLRAAAHRGHTTKNMFLLKPSFSPTV